MYRPKPKPNDSSSTPSPEAKSTKSQSPQPLDPCLELQQVRRKPKQWLAEQIQSLPPGKAIRLETVEDHLIELHRRCYEQSVSAAKPTVLRHFAASFPALLFGASWVRGEIRASEFEPPEFREKLLIFISNGLRSAASGAPHRRSLRQLAITAAKGFQSGRLAQWPDGPAFMLGLVHELRSWRFVLRAAEATDDWLKDRANEKAKELAKRFNHLTPRDVPRLAKLLHKKSLSAASRLVAARQFGVRERDLQDK